jgi:hypothetical protein
MIMRRKCLLFSVHEMEDVGSKRPRAPEALGQGGRWRSQPAAREDGGDGAVKENVSLANVIKSQHVHIRDVIDAHGGDAERGWRAALEDEAALQQYAEAMHALATRYWDANRDPPTVSSTPPECGQMTTCDAVAPTRPEAAGDANADSTAADAAGRYDDRLGYIVGAVRRYFCGVTAEDRGHEPGPPGIVAGPLKAAKRAHFASCGAQMPTDVAEQFSRDWVSSANLVDAATAATSTSHESPLDIVVVDVGSCYNPLARRFAESGDMRLLGRPELVLRPRVLGLDIAPHAGARDMARCDWTQVQWETSAQGKGATKPLPTFRDLGADVVPSLIRSSETSEPFARRFSPAFAHVVSFCLLLSYLPTPQLRARCVENAHRALHLHGLLVVVSTRTQGSRAAKWVDEWITAIESVGFARVDKTVKLRIVGFTFRKCRAETTPLDESAANKLAIIADDAVV